nr:MAG TPA: hypothetical protein [Caudoviricetes sp.]
MFFFNLNSTYFVSTTTDHLPYPAVFRRRGRINSSRPKNELQAFAIRPPRYKDLQYSPCISTALAVNISLVST